MWPYQIRILLRSLCFAVKSLICVSLRNLRIKLCGAGQIRIPWRTWRTLRGRFFWVPIYKGCFVKFPNFPTSGEFGMPLQGEKTLSAELPWAMPTAKMELRFQRGGSPFGAGVPPCPFQPRSLRRCTRRGQRPDTSGSLPTSRPSRAGHFCASVVVDQGTIYQRTIWNSYSAFASESA